MDVGFVNKENRDKYSEKGQGLSGSKLDRKWLQKIFMMCILMLSAESGKSVSDANEFHRGTILLK